MSEPQTLLKSLTGHLKAEDVAQLESAYHFSEAAHEGQFRKSGDPYIVHPLAVANILAAVALDPQALTAALLHDVMEDTDVTKSEISTAISASPSPSSSTASPSSTSIEFDTARGAPGGELPQDAARDGARRARHPDQARRPAAQHAHARRGLPPEKRRRIARETLDIYAPIANRLGLNSIYPGARRPLVPAPLPGAATGCCRRRSERRAATAAKWCRRSSRTIQPRAQGRRSKRPSPAARSTSTASIGKMHEKHLHVRERARHLRLPRDREGRAVVLSRARRAARAVQADPRQVQGLHRDRARRTATSRCTRRSSGRSACRSRCRSARRTCTRSPKPGVASHWLYKSSGRHAHDLQHKTHQWLQSLIEIQSESRRLDRVSRASQDRSLSGRSLRLHAEGDRSCRCRAARRRWTSPTPCTPTSATAASRSRSTTS